MFETPLAENTLRGAVLGRVQARPKDVWTPADFADLASRDAVDKLLQRLANAGTIRRIERGLYDLPRQNALTGRLDVPDYRAVIEAVARREQARFVIDGMTAANELGLTTALPAMIEVLIDTRVRPIKLGNQEIRFRQAAPSKLYWAGRPGMRIVQALHWMRDVIRRPGEKEIVLSKVSTHIDRSPQREELRDDLRNGLQALPIWMHGLVRDLIKEVRR